MKRTNRTIKKDKNLMETDKMVKFSPKQLLVLFVGVYLFLLGSIFTSQNFNWGFSQTIGSVINTLLIGVGVVLIAYSLLV